MSEDQPEVPAWERELRALFLTFVEHLPPKDAPAEEQLAYRERWAECFDELADTLDEIQRTAALLARSARDSLDMLRRLAGQYPPPVAAEVPAPRVEGQTGTAGRLAAWWSRAWRRSSPTPAAPRRVRLEFRRCRTCRNGGWWPDGQEWCWDCTAAGEWRRLRTAARHAAVGRYPG
ncbi:hypothetical protein [Actinoalloteichus caeruleus]|uniref:hypothetical protein n=1 Tax=Actinoalloteichus cyanogriseus TaxID=2893586 RepID=UPI003BB99EA7